MTQARSLVVGVGSPHGDDGVGWAIADAVAARIGDAVVVRRARTPAELLDWLAGIDSLDVCDAVVGQVDVGSVHLWRWPAGQIERVPFAGSHDLSLAAALALAEQLGKLPGEVRVWGVGIEGAGAWGPMSAAVSAAVPCAAEQICATLGML